MSLKKPFLLPGSTMLTALFSCRWQRYLVLFLLLSGWQLENLCTPSGGVPYELPGQQGDANLPLCPESAPGSPPGQLCSEHIQ